MQAAGRQPVSRRKVFIQADATTDIIGLNRLSRLTYFTITKKSLKILYNEYESHAVLPGLLG